MKRTPAVILGLALVTSGLSGCASLIPPEVDLRYKPVVLEELGSRPFGRHPNIHLFVNPPNYASYFVKLDLPEGYAILNAGDTLFDAYTTSLKSFFVITPLVYNLNYRAYADLKSIRLQAVYEQAEGQQYATFTFRHKIHIMSESDIIVDIIDIDEQRRVPFPYTEKAAAADAAVRVLEDMVVGIQKDIHERMADSVREGRYK